jgi:hypothetical protein
LRWNGSGKKPGCRVGGIPPSPNPLPHPPASGPRLPPSFSQKTVSSGTTLRRGQGEYPPCGAPGGGTHSWQQGIPPSPPSPGHAHGDRPPYPGGRGGGTPLLAVFSLRRGFQRDNLNFQCKTGGYTPSGGGGYPPTPPDRRDPPSPHEGGRPASDQLPPIWVWEWGGLPLLRSGRPYSECIQIQDAGDHCNKWVSRLRTECD